MNARTLDFHYFIGSTYTHLAVHRAEAAAARAGVALRWRPFSVRTLMREQDNIPFAGKPVKAAYMWRDIERRARRLGVPFARRPPYPIDAEELANRVATHAAAEGWCPAFTRAAYSAWFEGGEDPGTPGVLRRIVDALGRDSDAVLAAADSAEVRARYAAETDRARQLGIFGSPTFACADGEIFWGDDRLDDAIEWCVASG